MRNVTFEPTKTDDAPTTVFVTVSPAVSGSVVTLTAPVFASSATALVVSAQATARLVVVPGWVAETALNTAVMVTLPPGATGPRLVQLRSPAAVLSAGGVALAAPR